MGRLRTEMLQELGGPLVDLILALALGQLPAHLVEVELPGGQLARLVVLQLGLGGAAQHEARQVGQLTVELKLELIVKREALCVGLVGGHGLLLQD